MVAVVKQLTGGAVENCTLVGLSANTSYEISVRAYQNLLGPAVPINVTTKPSVNITSISWTFGSPISNLNNTQYNINCYTTTLNGLDVSWLINGVTKSSSTYSIESITGNTYSYVNTITIYPDPVEVSINATCQGTYETSTYTKSVTLEGILIYV